MATNEEIYEKFKDYANLSPKKIHKKLSKEFGISKEKIGKIIQTEGDKLSEKGITRRKFLKKLGEDKTNATIKGVEMAYEAIG